MQPSGSPQLEGNDKRAVEIESVGLEGISHELFGYNKDVIPLGET